MKSQPPQLGRRDRAVLVTLGALVLVLVIACPIVSRRSKAEFGDPGGPFVGKVVEKTIDLPPRHSVVVEFRLTVVDRNGTRRQIYVPFAEYRRAEPGTVISRDAAGKLRLEPGQ